MESKRHISAGRWTTFWNGLEIEVPKRNRVLENYNAKRSDYAPLRRIGVDREVIERVHRNLSQYKDPLLFHKFCRFFRRDPTTVQSWLNANSTTEAFERLYTRFIRNSFPDLKAKLRELHIISLLNRKGEGRNFVIRYRGVGSLATISGQKFTRRLNLHDLRSKYEFVGVVNFDGAKIICIKRRGQGTPVYKFVSLRRVASGINVKISADSKAEYALIRAALARYFQSYVDSPQSDVSLDLIRQLLMSGASRYFILVGATYHQDTFRISVALGYGQSGNVAEFRPYRDGLPNDAPEKSVQSMRLNSLSLPLRPPVTVDIFTSANSQLIGAVLFRLQDRRLNSADRKQLTEDFRNDFGFEPGTFVTSEDLPVRELYRRLLQAVGRRASELDLRSDVSLEIYKSLVDRNIIDREWSTKDNALYCVNRDCHIAFRSQSSRVYCDSCGDKLLPGRSIVQPNINEKGTAQYIKGRFSDDRMDVQLFEKKLLGRNLYIVSVSVGESSVEVVPISTLLNQNQMELLSLRIPNALVLTARDNRQEYEQMGIENGHLYEWIHFLEEKQFDVIRGRLNDINIHAPDRLRQLARRAATVYRDSKHYRDKNQQKKNLAAELFEAYTHLLLAFMFRNSIWLGASRRGSAVSDGISALPIGARRPIGCLLWDAKYSDGVPNLGSVKKNQHYIDSAKRSPSVRDNGGVKAYAFVGNKPSPSNFINKYKKLGGKRIPKICYMTSNQLQKIYEHFREHENDLVNNAKCRDAFIESMDRILIRTTGNTKIISIDDQELDQLLSENVGLYTEARTMRVDE